MKTKRLYEFGRFRIDTEESVLLKEGKPVYLKPKVFETLMVLVENRGRVLDKESLMTRLWQDAFVEEANLTVNISQLRKALGQSEEGDQYIETLPRRGYRFVAEVREVWTEEAALVVKEYTASRITIEEKELPDEETSYKAGDAEALTADASSASVYLSAKPAAGTLIVKITRSKSVVITAALILAVTALAFAVYKFIKATQDERFQNLAIKELPNTGRSLKAAISPDGKYLAHVMLYKGKQSLLLRQVSTASDVELVPPDQVMYYGLAFSPDGDFVYYIKSEYPIKDNSEAAIYRIPALGGASVKLINDVDTDLAFSPDGKLIAFTRTNQGESALIVANEDGSEEKIIATRKSPGYFRDLAWSPDGKIIACTAASTDKGAGAFDVVGVGVDDGVEKLISSQRWGLPQGIEWVSDGGGLLLAAQSQPGPYQIWNISYPDGGVRNITNDSNNYHSLSATSDSDSISSIIYRTSSDLWTVTEEDWADARQITSGASTYANARWTPDGRIVCQSTASGNLDIWIMQADGTGQKQLTVNNAADAAPSVSPDGRYIVFESLRSGSENIWRMDSDGNNVIQLTKGKRDKTPQCSPDGKWVVYSSYATQEPTLWKVPVDGGEPIQLTDQYSALPDISPDGKMIACLYKDKDSKLPMRMAILPFEGKKPTKIFDAPANGVSFLRWTKDGRALSFSVARDGAPDIWIQPIDGGPPTQLTDFKEAMMQSFDWSPDGRQLVCSRHAITYRVALINDSR